MSTKSKVLLIEDDPGIVMTLRRLLSEAGHEVCVETRGDTGLARAQADGFDVVLTDMKLPGLNGLDLVRELHSAKPRLPIILMTAHGTTETAIEATKYGAYDYLLKPFEMPELLDLVGKAVASRRLMTEPVELGLPADARDALVGNSRVMQSIYKEVGRIASRPVNILIRGETGTGKELIARAIYQHSDRAKAPFIAINCAAIPETLLESELFGHERGAFTGAEARRIGRFEQADHGTIFLDEIGDMTPGTQVKLLRVLQEKTLQRLGGKETIPVDVRVVAATHRDLEAAIKDKAFREDLYYRLSVVVINLPPLRERKEDIPELVKYFLRKYATELGAENPSIQAEALDCLRCQNWPGNVRELENIVRKVLLLAQGYTINLDHVHAALSRTAPPREAANQSVREFVDQLLAAAQRGELTDAHDHLLKAVERELFSRAIELAQGNQAKAARWVGVSRLTMREKLLQFGLHPTKEPGKD
ncbi:MAG TPA: sigma-54 dependent transcriptional regulator [Candidatus Sulfotelmatobacter sp.]|nr:sigma-54 dependent transcriptional regulator [Candidatus Sulfotelmatobacter sp.]HWI59094.1 sigma-54 dependent transcriptional regulator [Bacillota bacterium]